MGSLGGLVTNLISVSNGKEADILFLIVGGIVFCSAVVNTFFCIFLNEYGYLRRSWYTLLFIGISLIYLSVNSLNSESAIKLWFIIGEGVLGLIPSNLIRVKKAVENPIVEGEAQRESEDFHIEKIKTAPKESVVKNDIDFSHIKGVIERLEYYELTEEEKNSVRELQGCIYRVEHGESGLLKGKINDGLGLLLKIMAKYGI